jgi:hypothetical protein
MQCEVHEHPKQLLQKNQRAAAAAALCWDQRRKRSIFWMQCELHQHLQQQLQHTTSVSATPAAGATLVIGISVSSKQYY